jgi:hypothetical protein
VRRIFSTMTIASLLLAAAGCASSSGGSAPKVAEASPDRVTSAEIEATQGVSNAYDLVRRLRPRWLQSSGGTASIGAGRITGQVLIVYLDGNRLGGIDALRQLSSSGIKSMQYYDAVRAATVLREVGSEPISGAIVISTR